MSVESNAWAHVRDFRWHQGDPDEPVVLDKLRDLAALRQAIEGSIAITVSDAVEFDGMTWQQVADALGVTRQAAHGRYANRKPTV